MTNKERFAEDYKMPLTQVKQLVSLAKQAGQANEHFCNGDAHPFDPNSSDKNLNSRLWKNTVDRLTEEIAELVAPYGFTDIVFTGLYPTLKRGNEYVQIPLD